MQLQQGPEGPQGLEGPPGPEGPQGPPGENSQGSGNSSYWKTEEVGYFHLDLPDHNDSHACTIGCDLYYCNVYAFVDHICDIILLKDEDTVKLNIFICLKGSMTD